MWLRQSPKWTLCYIGFPCGFSFCSAGNQYPMASSSGICSVWLTQGCKPLIGPDITNSWLTPQWPVYLIAFIPLSQGNDGTCYGRYEGEGRPWRGVSLRCYVGSPGCGRALQAARHHSAPHQAACHWWQQVRGSFHNFKIYKKEASGSQWLNSSEMWTQYIMQSTESVSIHIPTLKLEA